MTNTRRNDFELMKRYLTKKGVSFEVVYFLEQPRIIASKYTMSYYVNGTADCLKEMGMYGTDKIGGHNTMVAMIKNSL